MPFAPLRLVHSQAPEPASVAGVPPGARPAPFSAAAPDGPFRAATLASFGVHTAILAGMVLGGVFGEERAAGTGEDVILVEFSPVELVESAPVPEAPPSEAAEAEPPADVERSGQMSRSRKRPSRLIHRTPKSRPNPRHCPSHSRRPFRRMPRPSRSRG